MRGRSDSDTQCKEIHRYVSEACVFHLTSSVPQLKHRLKQNRQHLCRAYAAAKRYDSEASNSDFACWVRKVARVEISPFHFAQTLALLCHIDALSNYYRLASGAKDISTKHALDRLNAVLCIGSYIAPDAFIDLSDFEDLLNADPSGHYPMMSAESREEYRKAVEEVMWKTKVSARAVVEMALELASEVADNPKSPDIRRTHIGYYLVGDGLDLLYRRFDITSGRPADLRVKNESRHRVLVYILVQAILATIILCASTEFAELPKVILILAAFWLLSIDSVVIGTEAILGHAVGHRRSWKLDLSLGIPDRNCLAVVVPLHLVSREQIDRALAVVRWNVVIANDTNIRFYFLSDFPDSLDADETEEELNLLQYFKAACDRLNLDLGIRYSEPIHILHRDREYSPMQQSWIGRERKRGKLEQFNDFVLNRAGSFAAVPDRTCRSVSHVTHVLCLDEDTRMTLGAAHELMGVALHPLNRPSFCGSMIVGGHSLIVPTCLTRTQEMEKWRFKSLVGGARMREDEKPEARRSFMFDFFGLCHYAGKGVYDIRAYVTVCKGKFPEDSILSHDTIEGAYLRPGFSPSAVLVEGFPPSLQHLFLRQHRWARGDIQNVVHAILRRCAGSSLPGVAEFVIGNQARIWVTNAALPMLYIALLFYRASWQAFVAVFVVSLLPGLQKLAINRRPPGADAINYITWVTAGLLSIMRAQFMRLALSPATTILLLDAFFVTARRFFLKRNLLDWKASSLEVERTMDAAKRVTVYLYVAPLLFAAVSFGLYLKFDSLTAVWLSGIWALGSLISTLSSLE